MLRSFRIIRTSKRYKATSQEQQQIDPNVLANQVKNDLIGLPDQISNIRPIVHYKSKFETPLEKKLRLKKVETLQWNQKFWTKHNTNFIKERQDYIAAHNSGNKSTMSADEMSVFYKSFLDKNWRRHFDYNIEWYKRNISILLMSFRVQLMKLFQRKSS